ncbi:MAG: hypothetical protein WA151_10605 [Desulfatirhabdiaceae bacterium]
MFPFFHIAAGFIVLLVLVAIVWRFSSLCASIACPAWLSCLVELDNPFFKNYRTRNYPTFVALTRDESAGLRLLHEI